MADEKRFHVFIAGERVGGAYARDEIEAVKVWIAHDHGRSIESIAESHHCRVTDIWAEEVGEKVYS